MALPVVISSEDKFRLVCSVISGEMSVAAEYLSDDALAAVGEIDVVATIRGAGEGHHEHRRAAIFVDHDQTEGEHAAAEPTNVRTLIFLRGHRTARCRLGEPQLSRVKPSSFNRLACLLAAARAEILGGDYDDESARPVDAFDAVEFDVAGGGRPGDEDDRPAASNR